MLRRRAGLDITPELLARKKTGSTDVFGRLWWDRPAFTIRTEFYKPEKGRYLHPTRAPPDHGARGGALHDVPGRLRLSGTSP